MVDIGSIPRKGKEPVDSHGSWLWVTEGEGVIVHSKMCMDAQIIVHLEKSFQRSKDLSSPRAVITRSSLLG
jgi:hypothetical protein